MLPAGHQHAASPVRYTTSCKHGLVLLTMGEIIARNTKHDELILIISKLFLLLHLVGCLYVGYSESKYRLRIFLAHPRDSHFAHVQ